MTDTDDFYDNRDRVRKAAENLAAAITSQFSLGMRRSIAKQCEAEFGPGPWILHPDGRIDKIEVPKPKAPRKTGPTRG